MSRRQSWLQAIDCVRVHSCVTDLDPDDIAAPIMQSTHSLGAGDPAHVYDFRGVLRKMYGFFGDASEKCSSLSGMQSGELELQLSTTNTWWRSPEGWEADDEDLRRSARGPLDYEPDPLGDIVPDGLYVLLGPRRVGKSVEIKRAIARLVRSGVNPRCIIHAAADGWRDADLGLLEDVGRRAAGRAPDEPRYWFIDEITSVQGSWPKRIKWLRDNTRMGRDCVVLSGSSARDLDEAIKELAGRRGSALDSDRVLLPMSFRSFCNANGLSLPAPGPIEPRDLMGDDAGAAIEEFRPWLPDLVSTWELFLRVGGFPRAVDDYLRAGDIHESFVNDLWDVCYGDAIKHHELTRLQAQTLLARLADTLTNPVNESSIARDVGIDSKTVKARIEALQLNFINWPCFEMHGGAPNLRNQNKVYFVDPLLARLAHLRNPGAIGPPDQPMLSEQQLGLALHHHYEHAHRGTFPRFEQVMFERPTRKEIDFIAPWMHGVPIEGKYVAGAWRKEAETMKAAYGQGVMATRSTIEFDDDVRAVPAPIIALLVDPNQG